MRTHKKRTKQIRVPFRRKEIQLKAQEVGGNEIIPRLMKCNRIRVKGATASFAFQQFSS